MFFFERIIKKYIDFIVLISTSLFFILIFLSIQNTRVVIDLPCTNALKGDDDQEKLFSLKLIIKNQLLSKGKGMREAFRKMGGAGDGEIDKYEFKACMRNNHIGIGNEKIVDKL